MDGEGFLTPVDTNSFYLSLDLEQRIRLRMDFAEELYGEPLGEKQRAQYKTGATFFDPDNRTVDAGDLLEDGRTWTVVEAVFGCRYLTIADYEGGFVLMALMPGVVDVYVKFDRPVDTSDRPTRRYAEMAVNPVPSRGRRQYVKFLEIAAGLVAESEGIARS